MVVLGEVREACRVSPSSDVLALADRAGEGVDGAEEQVAGDVLEVAAVLEPRAGHRDVVGRALALGLQQDRQADGSRCRPTAGTARAAAGGRWSGETSTSIAAAVGRRGGERVLAGVEARGRAAPRRPAASSVTSLPSGAVSVSVVGSKSSRPASASAITVSGEVTKASVLAEPSLRFGKLRLKVVTIVFGSPVIDVGPRPLADARAAGVGEHGGADRLEVGEQAVALDGRPDLLGAGRDEQRASSPSGRGPRLAGDRRGAGDVLVGRVGARADERGRRSRAASRSRRACGADAGGADLVGEVGGVRAVDVRLQLVEVDLDDLVVERAVVGRAGRRRPCRRRRRSPRGRSPSGRAPWSSSYGKSDVVAPISAPMLQIVALPVAEIESAPGPKYSTMAPVPPLTVRTRATLRMTSFGLRPAAERAGELARR